MLELGEGRSLRMVLVVMVQGVAIQARVSSARE
jgi:hypothetical protein